MIVATDIESNGFDEREGLLLELAFVVLDDNLMERASASWVIDPGLLVADIPMPLVVREMHEKSGLLRDIAEGKGLSKAAAQTEVLAWLQETFGRLEDLRQIPLLGSSVGFDRRWIRHHMPLVEGLFSHRSIDVSALTELSSRWNRPVYAARPKQDKHVPHRARDDARNSVEYLKYYRASGFINDSDDLREQARRHVLYFRDRCPFEDCDICANREIKAAWLAEKTPSMNSATAAAFDEHVTDELRRARGEDKK